jgi:hypothetical protein
MGSPRDKLEVRESFPKVTFHFVKNGRFQMKLAKADSLTGVLVFLSIAFDGCPKRGFVWVFFKCNECNARNSRMNIDTVSCNLHGGILWRSASHTDFRISRQPAHCKLECIFNYDIYIYIYMICSFGLFMWICICICICMYL